jgi:hypothetical protein
MTEITQTPKKTLATATTENVMPHARLTLIGTLVKPDSLKALVRVNNRRIRSVTLNDKISGARVIGIQQGALELEQLGRKWRLTIPGN